MWTELLLPVPFCRLTKISASYREISPRSLPPFRPVYDVLVRRLGASFMQYRLRPEIGKVEIAPFAYMRRRTFENAVVILDEAQNVTAAQMKMF